MVRILSVLPMFVGLLCATLLVLSIIGYSPPDSGAEVPIVPCTDSELGCNVGMTQDDINVPTAFILLDIRMEMQ